MKISVLMITYNRPKYTMLSLARLCDTAPENLKVTIWDNGSYGDTIKIVKKFEKHKSVQRIIYNKKNEKLRNPTNWFWDNNRNVDLLGKVDDDCLVSEGWSNILEEAHKDIPEAGVLSCWHLMPEDYDIEKAQKKIVSFGKHKILRNCWVGGSGYLIKRNIINALGNLKKKESFSDYCIRVSTKGYVNGWYFPFIYQEHMDDPRSKNTAFVNEKEFQKRRPLGAINNGINTREQWIWRQKIYAQRLLEYSYNPYDYIGLKAWFIRILMKAIGSDYLPKVK